MTFDSLSLSFALDFLYFAIRTDKHTEAHKAHSLDRMIIHETMEGRQTEKMKHSQRVLIIKNSRCCETVDAVAFYWQSTLAFSVAEPELYCATTNVTSNNTIRFWCWHSSTHTHTVAFIRPTDSSSHRKHREMLIIWLK